MELTLSVSLAWGRGGLGWCGGGGRSGVCWRSRLVMQGWAKAVGDAVGPGNSPMGVDKGLKAAEITNWGGVSHVFPVALGAMLADTADPEIIEARATVRGGENGELIRVDGVNVKDKKALIRMWSWGGCGGGSRGTATRGRASGGGLVCRSASSHWTRGGAGGSACSFAGQAGGVGLLVVGFANLVVADGQVIEVVLPMAKKVFHVFQDELDLLGWDQIVVLHGSNVGLGLTELMECVEYIVELVLKAMSKPGELGVIGVSVCLSLSKNEPGIFEEGEDDRLTSLLACKFLVKERVIVLDSRMELVDVTDLVGCMDVCIGLCGMLGVNVHDVLLELGASFGKESLVVSAAMVERLEYTDAEVAAQARIMEGTGFEEGSQDDGSKRGGMNGQREPHVVEEGITQGSEAFVFAVEPHLVM